MSDPDALITQQLSLAARPCLTMSFQAECVALLHMVRKHAPDIPVLFLDTWHHFKETIAYGQRLATDWGLNLVTLRAASPSLGLWQSSFDACCHTHKVTPLFSALAAYDTWFVALRREQSASRASLEAVEIFQLPDGPALRKISPLAHWTTAEVDAYLNAHRIPRLPLYDLGYTSIGCAPCTRLSVDSHAPRSGRWNGLKLECGIHVGAPGTRGGS
jgi:phosphoadenosine phosphosulfate reductase